jgi:hypothetical protein
MADVAETRFGLDGKVMFELSDGSLKTVDLANLGGAAGAGVTNISFTRDANTVVIVSDTGNDAILPEATGTQAGIMSSAQATKLAAQSSTPVLTVAGKTGAVTLTGADVGLGNVNNTTDANKPVSTLQQLALNQKQNNLTGTGDVPGLTTALAGKQATLNTYTEVPGLTVALNAKQATLTGVADVPNLQAALNQKQGNIAAGTNQILGAPATAGGAPVLYTLGTNLSLAGNVINSSGGGSGGSTTFAGLTDAGTAALPTINAPLQVALANKSDVKVDIETTTAGTIALTAALHDGHRILVKHAVSFTSQASDWPAGSRGCVIDKSTTDFTLNQSAGLVCDVGTATGSLTSASGGIVLKCVDGVLKSDTPSKQAVGVVTNYVPAGYAPDITTPSSSTNMATITIPGGALGVNDRAEISFKYSKTGTTNTMSVSLAVGDSASTPSSGNTQIFGTGATSSTRTFPCKFIVVRDRNSPNTLQYTTFEDSNPYTPVDYPVSTVAINANNTWKIYFYAGNNASTDSIRIEYASVTIYPGTVS